MTQNENNPLNGYVTTNEAAAMLSISIDGVRKLCARGRLHGAIKAGQSWIIPKPAVEKFEKQTPGPKPKERRSRRRGLADFADY